MEKWRNHGSNSLKTFEEGGIPLLAFHEAGYLVHA
jgi:hypothetical protein